MKLLDNADQCVEEIIRHVGQRIVLATPLGLGKPVQLLNAIYQQAKKNPSIHLTVLTALSFVKPVFRSFLAKRLLSPYVDRVYGDYQDSVLEIDRRAQLLPENVRVVEFFLTPGAYLDNASAQQNLIYSNYTHVVRDILSYGVNVFATMIACQNNDLEHFSLGGNADLAKDLFKSYKNALLIGQINTNMPYMYGSDVEIPADRFHLVYQSPKINKKLFSIPKQMITDQEYMIGLYTSSLIEDDGCLQIGIGNLSDALVYGLIIRHTKNAIYNELLNKIGISQRHKDPFSIGLFAWTEMLVDGYLELYKMGILKKELKDSEGPCLAHAGFFIGSNAFYESLRIMPEMERRHFSMRSIKEINQLYGNEEKKRASLKNARFVNCCIKATLLGEVISDSLENGLTVSGVGGQYNFVAMAHELENARSIIMCRSVRYSGAQIESNIVMNFGPSTIPRHLRDIVVTEYGIADLRGKTDEEVVKAMLNIADSRFQNKLLEQAKAAKKVAHNYNIPTRYNKNLPATAFAAIHEYQSDGLFPAFPFGSEFEKEELEILDAMHHLQRKGSFEKIKTVFQGLMSLASAEQNALLKRMDLAKVSTMKEWGYRLLLLGAMKSSLKQIK